MKNANYYIDNNDFEGAKERLEATSARWKKHWFEVCATIFNNCKELAKKYVLCPAENAIKTIKSAITSARKTIYADAIFISQDCKSLCDTAKEKCYLFEFLDKDGNSICSKVGTTTRTVVQRLKEELRSKTYANMGAVCAVIHRVYDCGEMPAEGLESHFRANYIKRYPNSFCKNDRFISEKFDLVEADKIAIKYLTN